MSPVSNGDYEGVVILGFPRSGTTLLRRLVSAHPEFHCPPETNLLSAASRFLEEYPFGEGLSVGVRSGLAYAGVREEEVLEEVRGLVFSLLRRVLELSGKRRWVEKTAFDSFHLKEIDCLLGDSCRYICLFRHPLDVVCSVENLCAKMGMYLPELHQYVSRYPSPREAFCHAWADVNRDLLAFSERRSSSCLRIRYEDLVEDPENELKRIFGFLGEPTDIGAVIKSALGDAGSIGLGDWKVYETTTIGAGSKERWRRDMGETEAYRYANMVEALMRRLDYEMVPSPGESNGEEARRRHQLERMVARLRSVESHNNSGS